MNSVGGGDEFMGVWPMVSLSSFLTSRTVTVIICRHGGQPWTDCVQSLDRQATVFATPNYPLQTTEKI